jgi:ABC-type transport system involved in multi-copper enzyme maturation permease subunit
MRILAIGINVFREAIRDKILYNLLFFATLMIAAAGLLSTLTFGEQTKIIIDIGLAGINIFGVLIAIFLGISLVSKEIDKRTIYTILSKPIRRSEFLLGKYAGLLITLLVNTIVMTLVFVGTLAYMRAPIPLDIFIAIGMIYLELMVITAVALFFSTFTTATLSTIFTIAVYVIGHTSGDLVRLADKFSMGSAWFRKGIYYALPNLENFNFKGYASHLTPIPGELIGFGLLYGILYIGLLMALSVVIFGAREFK